jgi:hypothetical protein
VWCGFHGNVGFAGIDRRERFNRWQLDPLDFAEPFQIKKLLSQILRRETYRDIVDHAQLFHLRRRLGARR